AVTTREVSEYSRVIAQEHDNEEFYTSHAWLTQLENKDSIPSIYKLFSLSVIYRTKFTDLLATFGIDLNASARYQTALSRVRTSPTLEVPDPQKLIRFPVRFDKGFNLDQTSLISRMVEVCGEVARRFGSEARCPALPIRIYRAGRLQMYPLLRPGSFVQIDS